MRRLVIFMLGMLLLGMQVFAQYRTVTGKITDVNATPVPGATITATGTNVRTVSAGNGDFSITVPAGTKSLTVSSVGYGTQTIVLGVASSVNFMLSQTVVENQAVVITGYKNVERSKYAGAASKVDEKAFRNVPVASFDQALQGRAPGLTVLSGNGQPGSAANVILRGPTSIEGGSTPLYIIDGIPVEAAVFQSINPNDIVSVDVLKDASAAALYGSRGAAGVIVVSTRRGKSGKMKLGFSTQFGTKFRPEFGYTPMTSAQLLEAQEKLGMLIPGSLSEWGNFPILPGWQYSPNNPNKLVRIGTFTQMVPKTAADIAVGNAKLDSLRNINHDWFEEFFKPANYSNNEISFSGGEGKTRIYSNVAFYTEEGFLEPTDMKRVTVRTNVDYKDDKLTLALSSILGYTKRNLQTEALNGYNNFINPFGVPQLTPGYITPKLPDGRYNVGTDLAFFAPTSLDKAAYDRIYNDQGKATIAFSVNYDFTKNFYAGTLVGVDFRETQNTTYRDPRPFNTKDADGSLQLSVRTKAGSMAEALTRFLQPNVKAFVGYKNTFNQKHTLDVSGYAELLNTYNKTFSAQGFGIDTLRPNTMAAVTTGNAANQLYQIVGGGKSERSLQSLLGMLQYDYLGKYAFTASYRYDGVSSLPEKNRFHGFYSVGGVWDIMKENFMGDVSHTNALRLKASYGQTANVDNFPFGDFGYIEQYNTNVSLVSAQPGISVANPGNPEGDWEFTNTTNVGIEFGFLKNRLYGDVQLYNKLTKNLFASLSLSATSGFGAQDVNAGEMYNRGIEYSVNYDIISNKDLTWTVNANGAYNKNEVTSLGNVNSYEQGTELVTVGLPLGSHYEVKWAGVDAATGAPLYYTKDGKLTTTHNDLDKIQDFGTWIPSVTGGFGTSVTYKGLDFTAFFNYAANTTRVNNMEFFLQNPNFLAQGVNQDVGYNFWTKPGDVVPVQSPLYQNDFSSRLIQKADWLRLRNVTVSYNFSKSFLNKVKHVSSARIYVQGQNLITWSQWKGLDPEDSNNISSTEYPNPRAVTAGLEIRF